MRYATPAAFRDAIEDRIRSQAAGGADPMRIRQHIVFERLLARLVHQRPGDWVLKGGVALEVRLRNRARATKDLDLAVRGVSESGQLIETLAEALGTDPDDDYFTLRLGQTTSLAADEAGRPGWRTTVDADLAGRLFASARVDVVARSEELAGTERIVVPSLLSFAEVPGVEIDSVDPNQHFAEKLHAYTLDRGERENTRVKDLVDLVLLIEDGLDPGTELRRTVDHVFATRNTHAVPTDIPMPPAAWGASYAGTATELDLRAATLDAASDTLTTYWRTVPPRGN
jgi:hypothetical protein